MTQNKTYIIGITGGIGTGKSTVTKLLIEKGYTVIDADKISREVVEKDMPAYEKIVEEFGKIVLKDNGELDRQVLGDIVFADEKELEKLNNIIHSYIYRQIKLSIDKLSQDTKTIFIDIPLLFEVYDELKEYNILFNEIWLVYADIDTQIQRIIKRDNISTENAIARINTQMNIEEKKSLASEILHNSGTLEELEKQIDKLLKRV